MWLYQRRNLKISIIQFIKINESYHFLFSFENISRLPILISRIEIISKDKSRIQCSLASEIMIKTTTKSGKDGSISNNSICTTQFPIPISSLGGTSERVVFNDDQNILENLPKDWNFRVCTNRGKAFQIKLPYVDPVGYEDLLL